MAKMPGARQRPLASRMTQPKMTHHDIVCIHTQVGSLNGTEAMFKRGGYTGTESHFGTGGDGEIRQWVDTAYSADANYQGSRRVISIENADHGPGFKSWNTRGDNVPPFTPAQIEANAQIIAWAHKVHGIPIRLIKNTRPGQRGVGYHAQGVPGNGLVSGGISWSKARGKVCPGRRRIAQIPQIIARAKQIAAGQTATPSKPAPAPVKKGILGMSTHVSDSNRNKRTIGPGKTARVAVGKFFSLTEVKKGQSVVANLNVDVRGLFGTEHARGRLILGAYNPKAKPDTRIAWRYSDFNIIGVTKDVARGETTLVDKIGVAPKAGESLRLQLEITNPTDHEIEVSWTSFNVLKD